jgi:PAS domain-containing protein
VKSRVAVSGKASPTLADTYRVSESIGLSVFDSLSDPIAVLDQQGVIRNVNEAWRQFAFRNDYAQTAPSPIGLNYLSICARAGASPDGADGPLAADGIRAVIAGTQPEFHLEYPRHSPNELRRYRMTVIRHGMPLRPGLLVCPAPAGRRLARGHGRVSRITGLHLHL